MLDRSGLTVTASSVWTSPGSQNDACVPENAIDGDTAIFPGDSFALFCSSEYDATPSLTIDMKVRVAVLKVYAKYMELARLKSQLDTLRATLS